MPISYRTSARAPREPAGFPLAPPLVAARRASVSLDPDVAGYEQEMLRRQGRVSAVRWGIALVIAFVTAFVAVVAVSN